MESGIYINEEELEFVAVSKKEIGLAQYCKSFKLALKDIRLIAISPRLALDDECLFILIVDKEKQIFPIPYMQLHPEKMKDLERHYCLKPITREWSRFEYEDHYGKVDKIISPKKYYWEDLFEDNWKLIVRQWSSGFIPKSFFGDVKNFDKI